MIQKPLLITILSLATLMVGCSDSSDQKTTAQQFDKVKKETSETAQDMKDYTFAQKDTFIETMQQQMDAINRDLEKLEARIEKSSDTAKAEAKPKLQALRDQAAKLNQKLGDAKNASESTWSDVKAGFKKGYDELKDGFQSARQWVSDKIAP